MALKLKSVGETRLTEGKARRMGSNTPTKVAGLEPGRTPAGTLIDDDLAASSDPGRHRRVSMRPATSEHLPDPATHVTHVGTAGSGDESGGEGCLCRLCFTRQRRLGQTLLTQRPLGSSIWINFRHRAGVAIR